MSMLYNLSISTLRNKIRMQNRLRTAIAYSLYLYILQHALARPLDHACSGIGLFHFIPVHPLWMAKFHKVVLSRVPTRHLSGVLFEYWDVSRGQNRHVQGMLYRKKMCLGGSANSNTISFFLSRGSL